MNFITLKHWLGLYNEHASHFGVSPILESTLKSYMRKGKEGSPIGLIHNGETPVQVGDVLVSRGVWIDTDLFPPFNFYFWSGKKDRGGKKHLHWKIKYDILRWETTLLLACRMGETIPQLIKQFAPLEESDTELHRRSHYLRRRVTKLVKDGYLHPRKEKGVSTHYFTSIEGLTARVEKAKEMEEMLKSE